MNDFSISTFLASDKLGGYITGAILLLVGLLLARFISKAFERTMQQRLTMHQLLIWRRIIKYSIFTVFLISALREMGFQLSVLLGAAGIFSVAIGFASQTSASNLISGLFLIGEGPFALGDTIKVSSGIQGEVMSIDLLSVKLRTSDNLYVRIPNEQLIKSEVTNLTRFPIRRASLVIGIAYKEDINRVRRILLNVMDQHPLCLDEPAPQVTVQALGASSVDLVCNAWSRRENFSQLQDAIFEDIKKALDDAGVEIPFPQIAVSAGANTPPIPLQISAVNAPSPESDPQQKAP